MNDKTLLKKNPPVLSHSSQMMKMEKKFDQSFFGHGKVLLSGEYFVLDGAKALALPTTLGQEQYIKYEKSFSPKLIWKSFDHKGEEWFSAEFDFWQFERIDKGPKTKETKIIQSLLLQARKQNKHFLREEGQVLVETYLQFPRTWGLGSSSTLVYNMAQWAYIGPYELLFETLGGSGYDVACARSHGPILYEKQKTGPKWGSASFFPTFSQNLYFVYLGKKQDSKEACIHYEKVKKVSKKEEWSSCIRECSDLTDSFLKASDIHEFSRLMKKHENFISKVLDLACVKDMSFSDFPGEIKSLGAWGGDFALVADNCGMGPQKIKEYFYSKGKTIILPFDDVILTEQKTMGLNSHGLIQ